VNRKKFMHYQKLAIFDPAELIFGVAPTGEMATRYVALTLIALLGLRLAQHETAGNPPTAVTTSSFRWCSPPNRRY
jgi:hypothetical protein